MSELHQGNDIGGMMGTRNYPAAAALGLLAAACGGGGGTGSGSGSAAGAGYGNVQLVGHSPADGAVQVPIDTSITLEFDATMAVESFADEDTWLRVAGTTTPVPMSFTTGTSGRIACKPLADLLPETDYEMQVSALSCDQNGRILDQTVTFGFRTYDDSQPTALALDPAAGSTGVARTASLLLEFDEQIDAASITSTSLYLRDVYGFRYPMMTTVVGRHVTLAPFADLPGNRAFTMVASNALTDRAGNNLSEPFLSSFTTESDLQRPSVLTAWPPLDSTGISPLIQPTFEFSESMDPATVEAASLRFEDEFGSLVPFAIEASRDQRTLRIQPLVALASGRQYTLLFVLGGAAATDVSGNELEATQALRFTTGSDITAPTLLQSTPADNEQRVPGILVAKLTFDEALDASSIDTDTVQLLVAGEPWPAVVELVGADTIRVTPVLTVPVSTACVLRAVGGQDGLRDVAGNPLAGDLQIGFTTSADSDLPDAMILPPDGAAAVAPSSRISIVFDAPMDPSTLNGDTLQVTDDVGNPLNGALAFESDYRVAYFTPTSPLQPSTYYRVRIVSGNQGARRVSGNWFDSDRTSRFRTGSNADLAPPAVTISINDVPASRRNGMVLPPSGFRIEVTAIDQQSQYIDPGSVRCTFAGGVGPAPEQLTAFAQFGYQKIYLEVPPSAALAAGSWTLSVQLRDLSGNLGTSNVLAFEVDEPSDAALPFERTQVVWIRTDMDRDNNGRSDFADDMLRLGFATAGDPIARNADVERLLLDAILSKTNQLYDRGARGEPIDADSVALRMTTRQPIAVPHMQMALGGLDPEGSRTRVYGAESTGVLGRAYYDYRNGNHTERNTSNAPGLGVFPAEMWLYQTEVHLQVYPSYQTTFASRFLPICPDMGGTPVGDHPVDAVVLDENWSYASGTSQERARWNTIMAAVDDWASVIGIVLAHEIGHSVGLVAPGALPNGLYGDSSLHDSYAGAAEVMAPSVGYEAMTSLDYHFRDLDLAYLRQRVLLR